MQRAEPAFPAPAELNPLPWYEFFSGGGMARLGLGAHWKCLFANDWSEKKAAAYKAYFGASEVKVCSVRDLTPSDLPGTPMLVWGSFPCQDLSLAGNGAGLKGERSGTFLPFWELVLAIIREGRGPRLILLENVVGTLTAHGGSDFAEIVRKLVHAGYRVGALVIDAVRFLPQSRPRLFVIAVQSDAAMPPDCVLPEPAGPWCSTSLTTAHRRLPASLKDYWIWWRLPVPSGPVPAFSSILEEEPAGVQWHSREQTERLISLMSPLHLEKLEKARQSGKRIIGTVYKRTRPNPDGGIVQRAEIRFDQISGCLRTPAGGSSRQAIMVVEGRCVRSRLLSPREAARLMGIPDDYPLPSKYNDAYYLAGDGVAVPVVGWLNQHLLLPIAAAPQVTIAA
jgi:DNA (cytosine-5)-methyltransferase 1